MSTLHTANKPGQAIALCLRAVARGDSVLLIEDAVYELLSPATRLKALPDGCSVYVMDIDARARGVEVLAPFEVINYDRFVSLCVGNEKVVSWF
ncbi:sulfurtransferase complex subunit TusB [Endozoicomonas sp. SCSIO W0465]|uniref:sulfurtransferase complex subunit TusB n=1 Tax=Endozoicomonas sp. SCSIO W0465 TaxID=2918516 RepID=UPI0020755D46|nr:sulfurtransferase complex subunit TusB [Endozoicomonas sp. SCSIO W0465]USE39183.1 sulfurtransferase complex subunit TusB [Endozoicomonas sp. SCSIO W0465]